MNRGPWARASSEARRDLQDRRVRRDLQVGRPDLERSFDDGGLVDVNHVPASALTGIPGITPELAARIVRVRDDTGGFVSAEEVTMMAGLPPELNPRIAEYGVFPR